MYLLHFCLVALHIRALLAFCDKIYARETLHRDDILPFRSNSVALRILPVGISPVVCGFILLGVRLRGTPLVHLQYKKYGITSSEMCKRVACVTTVHAVLSRCNQAGEYHRYGGYYDPARRDGARRGPASAIGEWGTRRRLVSAV